MLALAKDPSLLRLVLTGVPLVIGLFFVLAPVFARKSGNIPTTGTPPERRNHHAIGIAEGVSFLLLMGAMAIKRSTGDGFPVTVVGALHGALFLVYLVAVFVAAPVMRWKAATVVLALVASVVPLGTFALEWYLARQPKSQTTVVSEGA